MKVALITGAAKGIGAEIVRKIASKEYIVCVNYLSSTREAQNLVIELRKQNLMVFEYKADVSDYNQAYKMIKYIIDTYGKIDLLVNNAGISSSNLVHHVSNEEYDKIFNCNMKSVFNCTKACIPDMISRKNGKIINISSIWGVTGASLESVYSASKAAVIGFTKSVAKELAPSNIQVNVIAPGVIDTDMLNCYEKEVIEDIKSSIPLMKIGTPKDIADMVYFLASSSGDFITGQVMNINGGSYI